LKIGLCTLDTSRGHIVAMSGVFCFRFPLTDPPVSSSNMGMVLSITALRVGGFLGSEAVRVHSAIRYYLP